MTFRYLPAPFRRISEPFTAHCKFFRQIYQKKRRFSQNFQFFFFIPMIVPMLLLGHNTKKNYWPKSPRLKTPQKCQKMPIVEPISTIFCHFDGLHSAENLGGIALFFDMFLFKIWKNITFFPQESIELHVLTIFKPPQTHRDRPGGDENPNSA